MNSATKATTKKDIVREWHVVDAKGKVLGRVAVEIAQYLMGKSKPYFVRNMDCGDYVVVINAKNIEVGGKKATEKTYFRHSGYPSGLKGETFKDLLNRRPDEVIAHAVRGMLPQNKLRADMMTRLHVFAGEEHKYADKLTEKV